MESRLMKISDSVTVGGRKYRINTDFRLWIEIEGLLFDDKSDPMLRLAKIFALAYPDLPQNPYDAVCGIMDFYAGGESGSRDAGGQKAEPCYDHAEDFDYIWGGFMSQYGIDLTETNMHWWKFKALLACLGEDCKFSKIVAFRTMDTSVIQDKAQKRFYEKMKKQFRLKRSGLDEDAVANSLAELF